MAADSVFTEGKRSIICYYSRTGVTKRVVDIVQAKLNAEIYEVKSDVNYDGVGGYLKACLHAKTGSGQKFESLPSFADFDFVFLASPVWWLTVSSPIWAFATAADFAGKTVVTLPTSRGSHGKFNPDLQGGVKCARFVGKDAFTFADRDSDTVLEQKVTAWLQGL
jgi:flavodoxin